MKIGIISTGDELVDAEAVLEEPSSKIRDTNSNFCYILCQSWGFSPVFYGICPDEYNALKEIVKKAYSECDAVIVSGGSSVGLKDNTARVLKDICSKLLVEGIALKPGKPTLIGKSESKALIGLPGHPVSAFFVMECVVKGLLLNMIYVKEKFQKALSAKISEKVSSNNGRDEMLPVSLFEKNGLLFAKPLILKSGLITLFSVCDGYVHIKRDKEGLNEGEDILVTML